MGKKEANRFHNEFIHTNGKKEKVFIYTSLIGFRPAEDILKHDIFGVAYPCLEEFDLIIIRILNLKCYEIHNRTSKVVIGSNNLDKLKSCILFSYKEKKHIDK